MITKIMKHDFLALRKPLGITVGLTLLTAILSAIAVSILRTPVGVTIFLLAFLGMLAAYLVYSIILLVHYYRSMYGKTGYFTMSIPARPTELFWAKSLFNLLALCLFTLVVFCGGLLLITSLFLEDTTGAALKSFFTTKETWQVAFLLLMTLLLSSISSVFFYQFIVTAGNRRPFLDRFGKIGGPILVAVLVYVGMQIIGFLLMLLPGQLVFFAPDAPFISLDWDGILFTIIGPIDPSESNPVKPPSISIWWLLGTGVLTVVAGYLTALFLKKGTSLR
ncbi:hypothetical protein [Varibaculum cambriense]|uniref:hypothetical protein n=1 Tax=Varibaculum cambriense TaxID=184870 RepID=UPI00242EA5AC|nr:hypothetical protein [Varibaculum cambriense]